MKNNSYQFDSTKKQTNLRIIEIFVRKKSRKLCFSHTHKKEKPEEKCKCENLVNLRLKKKNSFN